MRFEDCSISRQEDGLWLAESLEFPGCASLGRTPLDAVMCIREAVSALAQRGPSDARTQRRVARVGGNAPGARDLDPPERRLRAPAVAR